MTSPINRRHFLAGSAAALSLTSLSGCTATRHEKDDKSPLAETSGRRAGNPIGVSTYSFWRFGKSGRRASVIESIQQASAMGFDGVEVLEVQMGQDNDLAARRTIKREALHAGLPLIGLSTHQGFVSPDAQKRQANIDKTTASLELAYDLGIPTMRVNTGTWGTSKSFDALMANKGIEEPLEGYNDEQGFEWVIDAYSKLAREAEKRGVVMGLENHWGLGRLASGVMRVVNAGQTPRIIRTSLLSVSHQLGVSCTQGQPCQIGLTGYTIIALKKPASLRGLCVVVCRAQRRRRATSSPPRPRRAREVGSGTGVNVKLSMAN